MRKPKFIFKPVISKAQMIMQAMMAAMLPKDAEESNVEFPNGSAWGNSGHEKSPHVSEVAHLSKKERLKRRRTYRLSTRKRER